MISLKKLLTIGFAFNYSSFSDEDFKYYSIAHFIPLISVTFVLFLLFVRLPLFVQLLPFSLFVFTLGHCLFFWFCPSLADKYRFFKDCMNPWGMNLQINIVYYFFVSFGLFFMAFAVGSVFFLNWVLGFGLGLVFLVPSVAMFCRWEVFSSDNCFFYTNHRGNDKLSMGYNSSLYLFSSYFCGFFYYPKLFVAIEKYVLLGSIYGFLVSVIFLAIFIVLQLLLLFPDKINEHLSFDLRINYFGLSYVFLIVISSLVLIFYVRTLFLI